LKTSDALGLFDQFSEGLRFVSNRDVQQNKFI